MLRMFQISELVSFTKYVDSFKQKKRKKTINTKRKHFTLLNKIRKIKSYYVIENV